ncbi:hypothetical protein CY35_01G002200 [Sphagnum magellanicum]|nr:hypothetical protein CY35_01G002200 [Sphagnum magellanicum]
MMAQNTSENKEIANLDSHETTKPSESVGAIGGFLKPYFDMRDQLPKPATEADGDEYFEFLGKRGKIYEKALETARETERKEKFGEIEGILVDKVEKDFQTYPKGQPKCGRIKCWAARLGLVNIVVALVRRGRADDPESPTPMSKGLLALAIAAENNDLTMVDALKDIAVADESFFSNEPHLFSPDKKKLHWFYSKCDTPVYLLYPIHEVWLCPIEAAARLGHVAVIRKLIELRQAKIESSQEEIKKRASEIVMLELGDAAARLGHVDMVTELIVLREAKMNNELVGAIMTVEKLNCRRAFNWAVKMGHLEVVELLIDMQYIEDLNEASDVHGLLDNADLKTYGWHQTPLALAVLSAKFEIVVFFCKVGIGGLRTDAKNGKGQSAIQMALEKSRYRPSADYRFQGREGYDIWNFIMERADSRREVKRLTDERKVHVDAINAILVGTALIATATFAGWLSPPLGYSSPPGTDGPFASVEGHPILESFWVFNSLSFFFSIATFMVGANVALPPKEHDYIGEVVQSLRWKLRLAYCLVSAAVFFVIGAFASAGFAVLPPIPKYTINMALTVGIGVTVVAVVVFTTFFGHMFTKSGWQQLKDKMKFRCWQQSKDEMESSDDD